MGIKVNMDIKEIRDYIQREVDKRIYQVIASLQRVGEQVVNEIRTEHISEWIDRTGNLRSSIGYIISVDGEPFNMSGFAQIDGPDRGTERDPGYNKEDPKEYARSLCKLYPKGIALIVVAGMEYASYVEAMENKTVLAQGEIEARKLVNEMIDHLNKKWQK